MVYSIWGPFLVPVPQNGPTFQERVPQSGPMNNLIDRFNPILTLIINTHRHRILEASVAACLEEKKAAVVQ